LVLVHQCRCDAQHDDELEHDVDQRHQQPPHRVRLDRPALGCACLEQHPHRQREQQPDDDRDAKKGEEQEQDHDRSASMHVHLHATSNRSRLRRLGRRSFWALREGLRQWV
jgi:hypothetical protein